MLEALAAFAVQLGIPFLADQINKIIDQHRSLSANEANVLANRIINAAEKKGNAAMTKAMTIMNNIPALSASPAVKQYMIKATNNAQQNYSNVEKAVSDMKAKAQEDALNIGDYANKSVFTSIKDRIISGTSDRERAEQQTQQALNNIENKI